MATEQSLSRLSREKFTKYLEGPWGLATCAPHHQCPFCAAYGEQEQLRRQFRNFYVAGTPTDLLPEMLDRTDAEVTAQDIEAHGFRQSWHRRRASVRTLQITPELVGVLALRRFVGTQSIASGNSADKSLDLLAKIAGIGKEVTVSGHIGFSWEQAVRKSRDADGRDMVITVPDDDIVELPDDRLEDADA